MVRVRQAAKLQNLNFVCGHHSQQRLCCMLLQCTFKFSHRSLEKHSFTPSPEWIENERCSSGFTVTFYLLWGGNRFTLLLPYLSTHPGLPWVLARLATSRDASPGVPGQPWQTVNMKNNVWPGRWLGVLISSGFVMSHLMLTQSGSDNMWECCPGRSSQSQTCSLSHCRVALVLYIYIYIYIYISVPMCTPILFRSDIKTISE